MNSATRCASLGCLRTGLRFWCLQLHVPRAGRTRLSFWLSVEHNAQALEFMQQPHHTRKRQTSGSRNRKGMGLVAKLAVVAHFSVNGL